MNLAQRAISKLLGLVNRSVLSNISNYPEMFSGLPANTIAGVNINERNSESITAIFSCLRVRAETMATIKTLVHKIEGDKRIEAVNHPVYNLVSFQASDRINSYDFWFTKQWLEDLWGNAFALIGRDSGGKPFEFTLLMPWEVEVYLSEEGNIWYKHDGEIYPQRDVLHWKQNSINGITGRSVIGMNRETLGLAKKQDNYASTIYGEKPPAVFEDGKELTADQAKAIAEGFKDHVKKGLTPMVWGGLKYKSVLMPPGDAQFIESKQHTKSEIYTMFRVPPHKLQTYSRESGATYSNVEQQNISFVTDVVIPITRATEAECNTKLFFKSEQKKYRVYHDLSELLRGDTKTEQAYIESMLTRGVINRNEARKMRGLNPIPGGDRFFIQAGFIPVDRIDDFIDNPKKAKESSEIQDKGIKINGN